MCDPSAHPENQPNNPSTLRRELFGFGAAAVLSLGIGLLINGWRAQPLPLRYASLEERLGQAVARMSPATPANTPQTPAFRPWQDIALENFQELVTAHQGLVIDARPETFYRVGHVPSALSLPRENFEESYAKLRQSLEQNRAKPIVVYCSEADCKDSELVAEALSRLGHPHLFVYKEGWEEWTRAGLPRETGPEP